MRVHAPFVILRGDVYEPVLADTVCKWFVGGFGLRRLKIFSSFPATKMALTWGYVRQNYLGQMVHSIPSQTEAWRQT